MTFEQVGQDLLQLGIAYVLAFPIGWDREREAKSAGIRTFPIVAIACCGLTMVSSHLHAPTPDSQSRVLQGLITGVGFIGGGAILKDGATVSGTATAASVLNVAIVGAAVGIGDYHIATVLAIINYITLRWLKPLKLDLDRRN